jgi:tetratricopeptide (TPR) repeat protein
VQVFVSYTGADAAWAEWIAWQLEQAGHKAIVQIWDFRPGENFVVQMRRALDSAERTLAVVSAAYLESVYGSDEWTAAFVHDRSQAMDLLVVRVESVPLPRLLRPWIYIDLVGLEVEAAAGALLAGLERGRRKPHQPPIFPSTALRAKTPSYPAQAPAVSNLPPRNLTFTGRDLLLAHLRQQLANHSERLLAPVAVVAGALYGLGGVGKTQLALEYAHRYAADYDLIWWIPAENSLTISASLARLASKLNLALQADQEELALAALDALRDRDRWLLVYDNAEHPDELARWQPGGGGGQVMVTSRNPAWSALARPIQVDVLDRVEATEFLLRRARDYDEPAASAVAEQLGDLPLALEQAAAYLEKTGMPIAAYLAAYQHRHGQLLAKGHPVAYTGQVDTTWQLSTDRLATTAPAGQELLRLCAFLAPEAIPLDLFTTKPDRLPAALAEAVTEDGEVGVEEAAGACYGFSLVARDQAGIRLHRIVQQVVRAQLSDEDRQTLSATAVELLAAAFPSTDAMGDPDCWPRCAQLVPHVLAATDHVQTTGPIVATTASVLRSASAYLQRRAEFAAAHGLLARALTLEEAAMGPGYPGVGATMDSLGAVLRYQGNLVGACSYLERALAIKQAAFGPDHPDLASSLCSLGRVLRDQGDFANARAHLERALAITETALGPDHPTLGSILDHLGRVLRDQGDAGGARAHLERSLAIKEAAYGYNSPDTGFTIGCLGTVLRDQGDLAGAYAHLERALLLQEAALGPDHPDVSFTLGNLGRVLHEQGDLAGARTYLERALAIKEAALGPHYPDIGGTLSSLGRVLRDQGDLAGARMHLERALAISEAALGPDHPWVAFAVDNMGLVLREQGDLAGARAHHERALAIYETSVGSNHLWVAFTLDNLGMVFRDQGDLVNARVYQKRAHMIFTAALGPEHPHTQAVARSLASL